MIVSSLKAWSQCTYVYAGVYVQEGCVLTHLGIEEHLCGSYRTPKCGRRHFGTCREEATLQLPRAAKTYRSVHAAHARINSLQKKKKHDYQHF